MSRLLFKKGEQKKFLSSVKTKSGLTFGSLARICDKNAKNLSDWYFEKSTMSYETAVILSKTFLIKIPDNCKIVTDFWYTNKAGMVGGASRIKKYGNPGTPEGRRLGGTISQMAHEKLNTAFRRRQEITKPKQNGELAEFFGILLGDGGISQYQTTITLSNLVDKDYSNWLVNFIDKLFHVQANVRVGDKNNIQITISRVDLVDFLVKNGLSKGNKVKHQIDIPGWITSNRQLAISCVRGLIDTDGCIYMDKHKYKSKIYHNICLDFTNASQNLLNSTNKILTNLGLEPKKYEKSIKIRKEKNVAKYFKIVGSHNQKHINKFEKFIKGEVA